MDGQTYTSSMLGALLALRSTMKDKTGKGKWEKVRLALVRQLERRKIRC